MNTTMRRDADAIVHSSIQAVLPDEAVRRALEAFQPKGGRVLLVAAGKAAWQMAHAAVQALGRVDGGVVVTKYGHVKGGIPGVDCCEAGHPVPDANSFAATEKALALVQGLTAKDTVLFLLSGGGSALFEKPLVSGAELQDITNQLLASGADIVEMNTIRKRLSAVKGGRFAQHCAPARVFSIVLSDILGDPLDMIASGPACADSSTCKDAENVVKKYSLHLSADALACLRKETPKQIDNVTTRITGSVHCCVISCNSFRGIIGFSSRALPPPDRRNTTVSCAVNPCTRSSAACVPRQEPSSGTGCPPSKQRIWEIDPFICPYFVTTTPFVMRSPKQADAAFAICHAALPAATRTIFPVPK